MRSSRIRGKLIAFADRLTQSQIDKIATEFARSDLDQRCPLCNTILEYDGGKDAYFCPHGDWIGENSPANVTQEQINHMENRVDPNARMDVSFGAIIPKTSASIKGSIQTTALILKHKANLSSPLVKAAFLAQSHKSLMREAGNIIRLAFTSVAKNPETGDDPVLIKTEKRDGYELRTNRYEMSGPNGVEPMDIVSAFTPNGDYIGDEKTAKWLIEKLGIKPELSDSNNNVCSIGFCDNDQKWYGWSHRAIYGFNIGDVIKEGDSCTTSGYIDSYIEAHPEKDRRVPVGFECKTLDDCRRCAIAFADSVG